MSIDLWRHWSSSYAASLPQDMWWWLAVEDTQGDLELTEFYRDGRVVGVTSVDGTTQRAFLSLDPKKISGETTGCTCDFFSSTIGCKHLFELHAYVLDGIHSQSTSFSKRIIKQNFTEKPFDRSPFAKDRSSTTIQVIARLTEKMVEVLPTNGFPDWEEQSTFRNAWVLEIQEETDEMEAQWRIVPYLQKLNKAANGFLKGEKISPEILLRYHNGILSDFDRQLLGSLAYKHHDAATDMDEFIPLLARASNFVYRNKPIKYRKATAYLTLTDTSVNSKISVTTTLGKIQGEYTEGRSNVYLFDSETNELTTVEFPPNSMDLFDQLAQLPPVLPENRRELVSQLERLQRKFPVLLPDEERRISKPHVGGLTMMLRSNAAGVLDFGLRIQCISGIIALPGALPLVLSTESEEGSLQWVRDPEAEIAQAIKCIETLDVNCNSPIPFSGAISGYEDILKFLESLGKLHGSIDVLWDRNSKEILKVLGRIAPAQLRVELKNKRDWFSVSGKCQIGEALLTIEELLAKLGGTKNPLLGGYIQLGEGQWAKIGRDLLEDLERLRDAAHQGPNGLQLDPSAAPIIQSLSKLEVELEWSKAWQKCMERLDASVRLKPVLPANLNATLRDYQIEGFTWLSRLAEWGVGGILADDMGLGKTLQAIALLLDRASAGPSLVLAPTSVGFNWIRELNRFAPSLNPILYREGDRKDLLRDLKAGDIVVSSYAIALRDKSDLSEIDWNILVFDEAQAIKNAQSKTSKAVSELRSIWSIALTGTPIENHLGELWSLFHVVAPGIFGSWESFKRKYAAPIEKEDDIYAKRALAARLQPFVLRRTKSEVLKELPPRTESVLAVELSEAERAQYELVRRSAIGELEGMLKLTHAKEKQFRVLALLTRLRQFACHPGIVNKQWDRSSSKLELLSSTLQSLQEEGHRALVFSQFTEHLALIQKELEKQHISFEYLDGSTPAKVRQDRVDAFQKGNATAFLISLKAGGTGLNLTAADYVIHMDPWWNPAVEDQATDRAHRMGQQKPVIVYRIIARDTIEEQILALHESKRDLVESILDGTDSAAKLSIDELMEMIRS